MTVVAVLAHPDDETMYCGGLLAKAAARGLPVYTVTLSRGEAGRTLGICDQDELGYVRTGELAAAAAALGVTDTVVLDLPDGAISDHEQQAVTLVREHLRTLRPQLLVAFPPNGLNGHPDHVAAHRIAQAALEAPTQVEVLLMADEKPFIEPARPGYLSPEQVDRLRRPATLTVDLQEITERKLRALGHYDTQARSITKFLRYHPERLVRESYHLAYAGGQTPAVSSVLAT